MAWASETEREIGVGWQGGKGTGRSEAAKKGGLVSVIERLRGMGERQKHTHLAFISLSQSLAATTPTLADLCNSVGSCF
ncbi:hypothetical protein DVH24_029121 [Malus domestica]|uniref:Uncharacterized protein n=1 Tax=Malus domestica TaxID=3750 RepID=A0A498HUE2_MALDO|nr:hypothetical protein DVH24_029121 [Malus domestica]